MKNKKWIIIITCILVVVGIGLFFLCNKKEKSSIILEINPSIEIFFNEKQVITDMKGLNKDGEKVIKGIKKGKVEDTLKEIINNIVKQGFVSKDDSIDILYHTEGLVPEEKILKSLTDVFRENRIEPELIEIKEISKEAQELSKELKISSLKAAYIKTVLEEREFSLDLLKDKSIHELKEMKNTGFYCEEGYIQEGALCLKEIDRIDASIGKICPDKYTDINGVCYESKPVIEKDNYVCREEETLEGKYCINVETRDKEPVCESGIRKGMDCVEKTYVGDAVEFCRITPESDMLMDHKCYGPKPMINGGCLGSDQVVNGWCIDFNSYYPSDWKCPDGSFITNPDGSVQNDDYKCYEEKTVPAKEFVCEKGFTLENDKCIQTFKRAAEKERVCEYKEIEGICIDEAKTTEKIDGYVCNHENERLRDNICIVYEMKEAKTY